MLTEVEEDTTSDRELKVIIAGSRSITSYELVLRAIIESKFVIAEVVSGTARGVDRLGERYAKENNLKVKRFPADWDTYGKKAGYLRNMKMADYCDAAIVLWDGSSPGSKSMFDIMKRAGKPVFLYITEKK